MSRPSPRGTSNDERKQWELPPVEAKMRKCLAAANSSSCGCSASGAFRRGKPGRWHASSPQKLKRGLKPAASSYDVDGLPLSGVLNPYFTRCRRARAAHEKRKARSGGPRWMPRLPGLERTGSATATETQARTTVRFPHRLRPVFVDQIICTEPNVAAPS